MEENAYDLVVIGSGPAGQKGAIAAAKLGKRVAVVDRADMLGGVSLHRGTIPSKALREAILYLSGFRQRPFYGQDYALKDRIDFEDLELRVGLVVSRELQVIRHQLRRNGVEMVDGAGRFAGPHAVEVEGPSGGRSLNARHILIACGTRPVDPPGFPVDPHRVFVPGAVPIARGLPRENIVVGAGVIGLEYASMFAALGMKVTVIEQRPQILDFVDQEIVDRLRYHMRNLGVVFRLGESVESVTLEENGLVVAHLVSGKAVSGNALLNALARRPNTDLLRLEAAGLGTDARGRIPVNENYQTEAGHIYAAGDVIGFPALASTSMEQGRLASCHMFGRPVASDPEFLPYGIYTIPEISMVGRTEQQLTDEKIPYEFGVAKFEELARGQILGDHIGYLKLLFHAETRRVLGVHVLGEGATELVHLGQAVMRLGATVDYFRDTVFNYPTLGEAYKVAALDGLNKLQALAGCAAH